VADFGTDIRSIPDLDPGFGLVSGRAALVEDLLRRLSTPRGGVFFAPDEGYDLRALLNEGLDEDGIAREQMAIEAELERDERIASASVTLSLDHAQQRGRLTAALTDADGPFPLVIGINQLTVELLRGSA
jgi:hypothetical protein